MNTRAARQIRAGILAARSAIRDERVMHPYDDGTLFGQAYRQIIRKHFNALRLWRESDKWD